MHKQFSLGCNAYSYGCANNSFVSKYWFGKYKISGNNIVSAEIPWLLKVKKFIESVRIHFLLPPTKTNISIIE